jgi:hypothetical protein
MKLVEVLQEYSDESLDQLAADKMDEVSNLRLPRQVLIQEIASALSSLSYVGMALAPFRPPTYAFLKILLDDPDHILPADGFRGKVQTMTNSLTERVTEGKGLSSTKDYEIYLAMLRTAFESDGHIDRSEALLLKALREHLGIWTREHLLLEHHPDVRPFWDGEQAFDLARNRLLVTGIVLTKEDSYLISEEVCLQIRQAWDIALTDDAYRRFLDKITGSQLRLILESADLQMSGHKDERVERVIRGLVPPAEALDSLHVNEVRDLCRSCGTAVSGAKSELIDNLIDHFERGTDLAEIEEKEEPEPPPEPEERTLDSDAFTRLLELLTLDQLYDVLTDCGLKRSGSKSVRVSRLTESPWSEVTLLNHVRRSDLSELCGRLAIRVSGVKNEIIERLIKWASETNAARSIPVSDSVPDVTLEKERSESRVTQLKKPVEAPTTQEPPEPPSGLRDIQVDYTELSPDEQTILALLRSARSLTERDIERAAIRHRLGWFLTKAHMADLLARLRRSGTCPVRVRSVGATNIYEWSGDSGRRREGLTKEAARDLVDALRQGVVPERYLERLVVGQEAARHHLVELLGHVRTGRSEFKFIRGPYGSGKTFLCSWLREKAFEQEFAVATVRIGPDQPLSDLPGFFSDIVSGLRTTEKQGASALADVLESWLLAVHRRTAELEKLSPMEPANREKLASLVEARIGEELARLAGLDPGFAPAVGSFYRARLLGDLETASIALAWLRGSRALSTTSLRAIGVRGHLESDQVFPRIKALLEVIRGGRMGGLLLLVDELELVRRMPHARQREQAYETLRLLIDEAGENGLPGCLLLFTGTDALFEDPRYGMGSYEALANRVKETEASAGIVSMRQPVIHLEALKREPLLKVALSVREIHGVAYGWQAADRVVDSALDRIVDMWTSFGDGDVDRLPRPALRALIHVLDICEENPNVTPEECLHSAVPTSEEASALASLFRG